MSVGSVAAGFFGLVWRILDGVRRVLHLVLLLVIFGFILAALHTSIPSVPRSAALVIAPEGELVEQLSSDPLRRAFGEASGGPAPRHCCGMSPTPFKPRRATRESNSSSLDLSQPGRLGIVEVAGDRRRDPRVSRGRKAGGRGGRFARSDPVLPRGPSRRGVPRSPGDRLRRRLQLLPHVLQGRDRQARRRCQCVPCRHFQELYGSISRAATWLPANARKARCGSTRCGAPTAKM